MSVPEAPPRSAEAAPPRTDLLALRRRAIGGAVAGFLLGYPLSYFLQFGDRHGIVTFRDYLVRIGFVLSTPGLRLTGISAWVLCILAGALAGVFIGLEPGSMERFRGWLRGTDDKYKIGTLHYTRAGLFLMIFWLLWGDMIWQFMEMIYPASMSLQLERLGVPDNYMGYIMTALGAGINCFMVPIVSVRSDRTRSRWGRRIPYILFSIVPLCFFLSVLGFTDDIGPWIKHLSWLPKVHVSPLAAVIIFMGMLVLLYEVANTFVNTAFWYLFRDVIPNAFVARFNAAFRMVSIIVNMVWSGGIVGHLEQHSGSVWYIRYIYGGAAIAYFVGLTLMCFMVKEGKYPPPETVPKGDPLLERMWEQIKIYFRECFSHPLYIAVYVSSVFFFLSYLTGFCRSLYWLRHVHFTLAQMGLVTFCLLPIVFLAQFPLSRLVDKFHPIRINVIAVIGTTPFIFAGYFIQDYVWGGVVIPAFTLYILIAVGGMPFQQLDGASDMPLRMHLFPKKQYGQFASANTMLRSFVNIFGGLVASTFIGVMVAKFGPSGRGFSFFWQGSLHIIGVICLIIVYVYWKKMGAENFVYDPENPDAPIHLPNGKLVVPLSRRSLWKPILIGAVPVAVVLILGITGMVAMINRPDLYYEVDKDQTIAAATRVEDVQSSFDAQRKLIDDQHQRNLKTLAAKHWLAISDRKTELGNYQQALQDAEKLASDARLKLAAAASQPATGP